MSLARSVRSVGRGVPDSLVVPHPRGLPWECVAAAVKVSYSGWIWKILVWHETLTRALNRIGQWRKNSGQLLCPAPTSTSLPVHYCRPFSLGSRDCPPRLPIFSLLTTQPHPFQRFQTTKINPSKDGQGSNLLNSCLTMLASGHYGTQIKVKMYRIKSLLPGSLFYPTPEKCPEGTR